MEVIGQQCIYCHFARIASKGLECRFNAPISTGYEEKLFPIVSQDDWCGQFKWSTHYLIEFKDKILEGKYV